LGRGHQPAAPLGDSPFWERSRPPTHLLTGGTLIASGVRDYSADASDYVDREFVRKSLCPSRFDRPFVHVEHSRGAVVLAIPRKLRIDGIGVDVSIVVASFDGADDATPCLRGPVAGWALVTARGCWWSCTTRRPPRSPRSHRATARLRRIRPSARNRRWRSVWGSMLWAEANSSTETPAVRVKTTSRAVSSRTQP
jgi:hypothetical protein